MSRRRAALLPVVVVALVVAVPMVTLLVGTWLAGWRLQPVRTASMQPQYGVGSLLAVAPVDPGDIKPGAVVVFEDPARPGRLVAHRVVRQVTADGGVFYRTRGDANAAEDPFPVPARAVRGQVRWGIAGLGRVVDAMAWPWNALVLVGLPSVALVVTEVAAFRRRRPTPCLRCGPVAA